jgi:hypothetical protein
MVLMSWSNKKLLKQVMNLILAYQEKGFIVDQFFEKADFEDWIKWVVHEEQHKLLQLNDIKTDLMPSLF